MGGLVEASSFGGPGVPATGAGLRQPAFRPIFASTPAASSLRAPRMRVIDLDTGDTLQAANDDDLERAVKDFYERRGESKPDDEVSRLVSTRAYDASDS